MEKYRFDNSYEKVYEYDENFKAYIFLACYREIGIKKENTLKTKIKKIEKYNAE